MMLSKKWSTYLDKWDLVTQIDGDGGDSLNRTCVATILTYLIKGNIDWSRYCERMSFMHKNGNLRRHPDTTKWYSNWDRCSRDQMTPALIADGLLGYTTPLMEMFKAHLKRALLFTTNTRRNFQYSNPEETYAKNPPDSGVVWDYSWKLPDLTGPEIWALYIRGFNAHWLYPILCLLDLHTCLGSIVLRYQSNENDVINHAMILEYSKVRMDTPLMALARRITPRSLLQSRLDVFFGIIEQPPINELYAELK